MAPSSEIVTLHKYFLNADRMRWHLDQLIKERSSPKDMGESVEYSIYINLWYGCLRVVIEGWNDLKLSHPSVDSLFDSDKIALLHGVRNDIFHFQKAYISSRTLTMLKDEKFVLWVRSIHSAIGDALLTWMKNPL
jgi:hypothetical protein